MRFRYAALAFLLALAPNAAAQCTDVFSTDLSLSDVSARLFSDGTLFWRGGDVTYKVPKAGTNSPLFGANLWVGGTVDGEVRIAAAQYGEWEFYGGPLDASGAPPAPEDCASVNRIFRISALELAAYEETGVPTLGLATWPVGLGAPAVDADGDPIVPTSPDQTVDLDAGERPVVYGTETAFWVVNDVGPHPSTGSVPLGVEVRITAFLINDPDEPALDQGSFYRFEVVNKSGGPISNLHVGLWTEYDLGDATDDYVASDPARSLSIGYNANDVDDGYGVPPAAGADALSGGYSHLFYENTADPMTGFPQTAEAYYNVLRGHWLDGTPISRGGLGYNPGNPNVTRWQWDGDPTVEGFWTEDNVDGQGTARAAGDRRAVLGTPPMQLADGASHTVDFAILFAQGTDRLDSVTELRAASDLVQARYDDGSLFETTSGDLGPPPVVAPELLAPADGAVLAPPTAVRLEWAPVDGATAYRVRLGDAEDFSEFVFVDETVARLTYDVPLDALPQASGAPVFWSVAGVNESGSGPGDVRSFTYAFGFDAGPLVLSNGQFAFVEVAGPGGADPCGPDAGSTFGCDEVGGNALYVLDDASAADANSTGAYALTSRGAGPEAQLSAFAPADYEIRFTADGSIATHLFGEGSDAGDETHRVPFEIWDVGLVAPGDANDPADDVRMVPVLFSDDFDGRGTCAFDLAEIPASESTLGVSESDRIYAYYPTTTYADYDAVAAPLVDAAPDGCYLDTDGTIRSGLDIVRGRPLQRVTVADLAGTGDVSALDGTVIRFYTTDPQPVNDEAAPVEAALALSVVPNPSRGAARVRFALVEPGAVRVRVVDALGRTVAVLAEGERRAGAHEVALPAGLASGIYVVAVEAGSERLAQSFTVVR